MVTTSIKPTVIALVETCLAYGVNNVVISPGSRNAPLIIAFTNCPSFTCYSVIDERSAAFFALGIARQLHKPVAIVCTSGTAALNYSPAIAEAYYQNVPVIAITADRPANLIGKQDGQTIIQNNIFKNFTISSVNIADNSSPKYINKTKIKLSNLIANAIDNYKPAHINIQFNEPLYQTIEIDNYLTYNIPPKQKNTIGKALIDTLVNQWNKTEKIAIVVGANLPDDNLSVQLNKISSTKNVIVIASAISNVFCQNCIFNIDKTINAINSNNISKFVPGLVITLGGPILSKPLKTFLKNSKPFLHWDIDSNPERVDTFDCLTHQITINGSSFINILNKRADVKNETYKNLWLKHYEQIMQKQQTFFKNLPWCDLLVYKHFLSVITTNINLHLANSTPVRYIDFFEKKQHINYYTNRGTSGIDGSLSTAVGAATAQNTPTVIITGDISFVYDSNALWNKHIPPNLKIIVINNNGGNIFRVLNGPGSTNKIDFFETPVQVNIEKICDAFNINYLKCDSYDSFITNLPNFLNNKYAALIEIITQPIISANIYREYLQY